MLMHVVSVLLATRLGLKHPLFFFNDTATTEIYTLSLHDALPIYLAVHAHAARANQLLGFATRRHARARQGALQAHRSEEHTSELQSRSDLVCRLLLEKKKKQCRILHASDVRDADASTPPLSERAT